MSHKADPTKPRSNEEKFKPQNVTGTNAGSPSTSGRTDRDMRKDVARGSEPEGRAASRHRA